MSIILPWLQSNNALQKKKKKQWLHFKSNSPAGFDDFENSNNKRSNKGNPNTAIAAGGGGGPPGLARGISTDSTSGWVSFGAPISIGRQISIAAANQPHGGSSGVGGVGGGTRQQPRHEHRNSITAIAAQLQNVSMAPNPTEQDMISPSVSVGITGNEMNDSNITSVGMVILLVFYSMKYCFLYFLFCFVLCFNLWFVYWDPFFFDARVAMGELKIWQFAVFFLFTIVALLFFENWKKNDKIGDNLTIELGCKIDVLDSSNFWYSASITSLSPSEGIKVQYDGFDERWNEWISMKEMSYRIAHHQTRSTIFAKQNNRNLKAQDATLHKNKSKKPIGVHALVATRYLLCLFFFFQK